MLCSRKSKLFASQSLRTEKTKPNTTKETCPNRRQDTITENEL